VSWVRLVLFGATALALWLVAAPALAAEPPVAASTYAQPIEPPPSPNAPKGIAPLCDDRGATVLAPPPVLQGPESWLVQDDDPADACSSGDSSMKTYRPVPRTGGDSPSTFDATTTLTRVVPCVPEADRQIALPPAELGAPAPGVRLRVERPPRG
jgi:hypothetical protein